MLRSFEQHAVDLGATVHWGQLNNRSREDIENAYGAEQMGYWRGTLRYLCGAPSVFQTFDNDFCQSHGLEYRSSAREYYKLVRDEFPSGCLHAQDVLKPNDLIAPKPRKPILATKVPPNSFVPDEPGKKAWGSGAMPIDPIFRFPIPAPGPDPDPYAIRVPQRVLDYVSSQQLLEGMQQGALPGKYPPALSPIPQTKVVNEASPLASPNVATGNRLTALSSTDARSLAIPNVTIRRFLK